MPKTYRDTDDPRQALRDLLAFSSRDWGQVKGDAWLWGIVFGWDCDDTEGDKGEAMAEVAALHGWDDYDIARLRRLHANFERLMLGPGDRSVVSVDDDERSRIQQSNDVANVVFKVMERHGLFAYLDLRYDIADALYESGLRKPDEQESR